MANKKLFFLSLITSLLLYSLLIITLVAHINSKESKKIVPIKKSTTIDLSIITEKSIQKPKVVKKVQSKVSKKKSSEKVVKTVKTAEKTGSKSTKKTPDLNSLFGNVTTKKSVKNRPEITKDILNIERNPTVSRYKSNSNSEYKKSDLSSLSKLVSEVSNTSSLKLSFAKDGISDEYYSKVYEILSKRWNPSYAQRDLAMKVVFIIYSSGEFEYRVLEQSSEQIFNTSVINFLNNLQKDGLPPHNKSNFVNIEVTFKREE